MVKKIKIESIKIIMDRREVDNTYVSELAESIRMVGLLNPITVDTKHKLIAGAHRLAACKINGWTEIPANIVEENELLSALAEIDENIVRNDLTFFERAMALEKRKYIYENLHPETRHGAIATIQNLKKGTEIPNTAKDATLGRTDSFAENTAKLTGESPRTIYENISIAKNIDDEVKEIIKSEPIADIKTDLKLLSKQEPEVQKDIANKIANKEIERVSEYFDSKTDDFSKIFDADVEDLKNEVLTVLSAYSNSSSTTCKTIIQRIQNFLANY